MKRVILIVVFFFVFLITSQKTYATDSSLDLLRDLLQILFSFQTSLNLPSPNLPTNITPMASPNITPGQTPPVNSFDQYLPQPLNPISNKISANVKNAILGCLINKSLYEQASVYTGVAWQVLAGIHYVEANCSQRSLVSGRTIGSVEPDLAGECSSGRSGPGIPIPVPGGCGMASLVDSAIYAARHLKGKIGKTPENFQEIVKALGRYNGLGNQNCGKTPYSYCPPYFESEDHIYPLNWFDDRHETMYLVYCADHVRCNPPKSFQRTGVMTVARILEGK